MIPNQREIIPGMVWKIGPHFFFHKDFHPSNYREILAKAPISRSARKRWLEEFDSMDNAIVDSLAIFHTVPTINVQKRDRYFLIPISGWFDLLEYISRFSAPIHPAFIYLIFNNNPTVPLKVLRGWINNKWRPEIIPDLIFPRGSQIYRAYVRNEGRWKDKQRMDQLKKKAKELGLVCLSPYYFGSKMKYWFACPDPDHSPHFKTSRMIFGDHGCIKCKREAMKEATLQRTLGLVKDMGFTAIGYRRKEKRWDIDVRCENNHEFIVRSDSLSPDDTCYLCRGHDSTTIQNFVDQLRGYAKAKQGRFISRRKFRETKAEAYFNKFTCHAHHTFELTKRKIELLHWCPICGTPRYQKHPFLHVENIAGIWSLKSEDRKRFIITEKIRHELSAKGDSVGHLYGINPHILKNWIQQKFDVANLLIIPDERWFDTIPAVTSQMLFKGRYFWLEKEYREFETYRDHNHDRGRGRIALKLYLVKNALGENVRDYWDRPEYYPRLLYPRNYAGAWEALRRPYDDAIKDFVILLAFMYTEVRFEGQLGEGGKKMALSSRKGVLDMLWGNAFFPKSTKSNIYPNGDASYVSFLDPRLYLFLLEHKLLNETRLKETITLAYVDLTHKHIFSWDQQYRRLFLGQILVNRLGRHLDEFSPKKNIPFHLPLRGGYPVKTLEILRLMRDLDISPSKMHLPEGLTSGIRKEIIHIFPHCSIWHGGEKLTIYIGHLGLAEFTDDEFEIHSQNLVYMMNSLFIGVSIPDDVKAALEDYCVYLNTDYNERITAQHSKKFAKELRSVNLQLKL